MNSVLPVSRTVIGPPSRIRPAWGRHPPPSIDESFMPNCVPIRFCRVDVEPTIGSADQLAPGDVEADPAKPEHDDVGPPARRGAVFDHRAAAVVTPQPL